MKLFPALGRLLEDVRTHGRDPAFRKSTLGSFWSHVVVILIIPLLLQLVGCIRPSRPPLGDSGAVPVHPVRIVKKPIEVPDLILSRDLPILFDLPDLDPTKLLREIMEHTELPYVADTSRPHGAPGPGRGKTPGFWQGFEDGQMRFIRIHYSGDDWDDGMDSRTGADVNFLKKFREISGGMNTATRGESHAVSVLAKYPKGYAPPFVYMTGSGSINMSGREIKTLREYLRGGGMLFADSGSARWHHSFRSFISRLLPGVPLSVIADDDPIFRSPFPFPNGAPPLWHHGGRQALGVKQAGRWVVFYHPGDLNDAWKTGHSGLDAELAEDAFRLGVNVVYYATMQYLERTEKYRKDKK